MMILMILIEGRPGKMYALLVILTKLPKMFLLRYIGLIHERDLVAYCHTIHIAPD